MFQIKQLTKQYGTEFALQNVTMNIGAGMNFIIGSSGSGKTTLLKILCGMEQDFEGSVTYLGQDIQHFTQQEKSALNHSTFGFVWQDFHLLEDATVFENIMLPSFLNEQSAEKNAGKLLKQMKLEDLKDQKVKFLSGGQKQRVAIAREMMKQPKVIFCDEPTSALDAKSANSILDSLRVLAKSRTVIVVTHDTSLIQPGDAVFELDKGELISASQTQAASKAAYQQPAMPKLSLQNAFRIALQNLKNHFGRFAVSALTLLLAGTLLLTTVSGAIGQSGQAQFDQLVETYGEGILDIGLVGSFISAAGGDENQPHADVTQDLNGLYELFQQDDRVEFIVSMQPFENIRITVDGQVHTVEKTGNSPVLTKLLSGTIPSGSEYQVVIPLKFAESLGLTPETALGKSIDFSATVYQWINNQPVEKPIRVQATICGVADNTVVYDYQGKQYTYTVDDSFFFNRAAIEEIRKQAEIEDKAANFTIRAKTPEDLISLKDELNKRGIVPLGRFELVEDIVRLNRQTTEQSGSASVIIGVLAILLAGIVFAMTSLLRKREYAIYKVSGYTGGHLAKISLAEIICSAAAAIALLLVASPLLNLATIALFHASIQSVGKLAVGALLILAVSAAAYAAGLPFIFRTSESDMLKAGEHA